MQAQSNLLNSMPSDLRVALSQFQEGIINREQFFQIILIYALNSGFEELHPALPPAEKPIALLRYEELGDMEKIKVKDKVFQDKEVKKYAWEVQSAKNETKARKQWLEELLQYALKYNHIEAQNKIKNRLQEFI